MNVELDFELMERCNEYEPPFEMWDRHKAWERWRRDRSLPSSKRAQLVPIERPAWDESTPCQHCGEVEKQHGRVEPTMIKTKEGDKLVEFLRHFYGLEPKR